MNWARSIKRITQWRPFQGEGPPLMDPKYVSGLRVNISFKLRSDAAGLTEAFSTVEVLAGHIRACPEAESLNIEQMVELNGVYFDAGEQKMAKKGPDVRMMVADAFKDNPVNGRSGGQKED